MKSLAKQLKSFEKEAIQALKKGAVKDIEFARETYQVLVRDEDKEFWVFLQLTDDGDIKDAFCSAEDEPCEELCFHIAIAYLSLFKKFDEPLHVRFKKSLWVALCKIYEADLGDSIFLSNSFSPASTIHVSPSGKKLFEFQAVTESSQDYMRKLVQNKQKETEETSLKFSNLSSEEINEWKSGHLDPLMRFELSLWCDLAKWLMKKQENEESYTIHFSSNPKELPYWIDIAFTDVKVGFYISKANWPMLIEALQTVDSPLKVYYPVHDKIKEITYDKEAGALQAHLFSPLPSKRKQPHIKEKSISLADWNYVPQKGFYAIESDRLLKKFPIYGVDIAHVLSAHTQFIASYLVGNKFETDPTPLSYFLEFDREFNLHITAYLFERGDLTTSDSWLVDNWAYIDDEGFFAISNNVFRDVKTVISQKNVASFVSKNRTWLDKQRGFETHIVTIEDELAYSVNRKNQLSFHKHINYSNHSVKQVDFDSWIYLEEQGFFMKRGLPLTSFIRPGLTVNKEQWSFFIKVNYDDLCHVSQFFCEKFPFKTVSLRIEWTEKERVKVVPQYDLIDEYRQSSCFVIEDVSYIRDHGFSILPSSFRLPEKFQEERIIGKKELSSFIREELPLLAPYVSAIDERLIRPKKLALVTDYISFVPEKGKGWLAVCLYYLTDKGVVPVEDILKALWKKQEFLFSENGFFDLKEERFGWMRSIPKDRLYKKHLLLSTLEFMRLKALESIVLYETDKNSKKSCESASVLESLNQLKAPEEPCIRGLVSQLRSYQEIGLRWLWFLYSQNLSGLLCDDMGLGKTHQAMALLCSITNWFQEVSEGVFPKFLIVCPTSVLFHWQEKLQQYLPHFKVLTFYGSQRRSEELQGDYQIVITSYGTVRMEMNELSKIQFEAVIFDEIQQAKNHLSKIYSALSMINTHVRIGLTGTPIENRLRELKALFDLVLPSYMPNETSFRELFVRPIEKAHDKSKKELLNRLIHPFVLRRTKRDVLTELPEKTEEIAYCSLEPSQEMLYVEVLQKRRTALLEELQDQQAPVPYLHIFSLLSSLKQICDHPAVYFKAPQDYHKYSSGKWELFVEILREARESNQKVVIFSHYLHMLDIIESYCHEKNISFATIRGSTTNRKEQIHRFQTDPDCEVFVGSLHAAGLGIDLTAASVVIHYDRWWNAARENQATDRVHRIGQTRGVQVFKLVTRDTFEEKIDTMIQNKAKLLNDVVGIDDKDVLKTLSREELRELLETIPR